MCNKFNPYWMDHARKSIVNILTILEIHMILNFSFSYTVSSDVEVNSTGMLGVADAVSLGIDFYTV